jgi:DtxR family Mn-dependent transcriptional regulator
MPFLCGLLAFAALMLVAWWMRRLGAASLTGIVFGVLSFILRPGAFFNLAFVVAAIAFDVHRLEEIEGTARTKMLGRRLNVTLGTVTNNLSRLQKLRLVKRERYRGALLTGEGRRIAMSVLRRHRLLERLLTDVLHVGWSKSHYGACKLEHCIDDEVTDAIENGLAHPKTCPHGNAIPSKSGKIVSEASMRLIEISRRQSGTVVRVVDEEEHGALAYFESIGLIPGADFTVEAHVPFDGAVNLILGHSKVTVSKRAAALVVVKKRDQVKLDVEKS